MPSANDQLEENAAAASAPAADATSEYDLPDSGFDPELHSIPEPKRKTPAKGPDGKFIKAPKAADEPAPAPAAPNKYTHSRLVTRKALEEGYNQEYIDATEPSVLESIVDALDARHAEERRNNQIQAAGRAQQNQRTEAEPPPSTPAPKPDAFAELHREIDDGGFDDASTKILKSMATQLAELKKENGELKSQFEPIAKYVNEDSTEKLVSNLDKGFADLGEPYKSVFGSGAGSDMDENDPLYKSRIDVIRSLKASPIPGKSVRQQIAIRAAEMFGRFVQPSAPAAAAPAANGHDRTNRIAAWNGAATPKPTDRDGAPEPKGTKRAEKAVAQILHDKFAGESPEENDLPD